ncbi:MAG: hypothetical protein HWD61_14525 [Parachlamydiaceae bacterium]|nr:MAG: hypothetical protein HWD61_14525 [Parachlamydiaceae bacterium]
MQLQMAEEGQKAFAEQKRKEALEAQRAMLKDEHEKEIDSLKQQLKAQAEQAANEGDAKIMAIQLERLQEALQQMVSEKRLCNLRYKIKFSTKRC